MQQQKMGYAKIRKNYDNSKAVINKFQNISKKLVKAKSNLKYLLKCRKSKLIPSFIKNSTRCKQLFLFDSDTHPDIYKALDRHTHYYHPKILNLIIKHKHNILKRQQQQIEEKTIQLKNQLNKEDLLEFTKREENISNNLKTILKRRQEEKYEKLRNARNNNFVNNNKREDWFVNKTNVEFPPDVKALLAKGPKFALPVENSKFPLFQYIADGEDLIQTLENKEKQEEARTKFSLLIKDHTATNRKTTLDCAIIDTVKQTRKFLKENDHIKILTSDKGSKTVAMETKEYNERMEDILKDLCTYRIQRQDPTSRLQTKNNNLVDKLFKLDIITKAERNKLVTTTALAPRIYGLPKIHKPGMPLRPICSAVGSPSHGLCKYIVNILKNVTANSVYNVKNTIDFKEKINNTPICDDETLVSFDVVSLFPSVPIQLALDVIREKWAIIKEHTKIPKQIFMEIVTFCIQDNRYFKFNDKIYTQLKGLPMGSPTSPVIADIIMEQLLDTTSKKLGQKPRLFTKYVDDLFAIVNKNEVQNTLDALNSFDSHIKFTTELEEDGKLAYLDSIIIRRENELKVKWYRKPTASGRIINFNSKHPKTMIINTAMGCIRRMLQISDEMYHQEIKNEITLLLKNNDFPDSTIKNLLKRPLIQHQKQNSENTQKTIFKTVSYVPQLSERLAKSDCYNTEKVKIAHKPTNTLKKIFNRTKTKIPTTEKSNLVYKIPCNGNLNEACESIYVGTTKAKLKTRLSQHKSDYKQCHYANFQKTALMTHCAASGHSPNFDAAEILAQEQNYNKRYTLEMLHIINTPTEIRMNYKTDCDGCAHAYRHLLNNNRTVANT
ncbi:uncharacterized protein [Eurosta solidaginis]|uniref:uncharacterized protein n=1 Tax=Eurosta solidaginis TaxID=178769 RepID=UPI0035315C56